MAWAAMLMLGAVSTASFAQIVAAPGSGAKVIQTQNGLPQVNIARPSGAGVSLNTFSQFDVQRQGAILNNSPVSIPTQQAGYVNGNPNLQPNGSARIIVNQVMSNSPSQLRGFTEVAGPRAEVIIANPQGIQVDGAGFINTSRAVLTTGNPNFGPSGNLTGFNVTGGAITVQGAGLNATNVDQVDLLARAIQVNAAIYANNLNAVTGANQVDHDTLNATPIAGNGPAASNAIDVSQLGGMYAQRIYLSSNEYGVGVSTRGILAAQAGDLVLKSNGQLVLAGTSNASGSINASATQGIDNSGTTYAQRDVVATTGGALSNSGILAAQNNATVNAGNVVSTGTLAAGVIGDGSLARSGDLNVSASGAVTAAGRNVAGGNANVNGSAVNLAGSTSSANGALALAANGGDLNLSGASATAGGTLDARASGTLINDHGAMSSGAAQTITAGALSNRNGQIVSGGALTERVAGATNNQGGTMQANGALSSTAGTFENANGHVVSLGADGVSVTTSGLLNNGAGGSIGGNGNVALQAGQIANAGSITATQNLIASAVQSLFSSGTIASNANVTLNAGTALTNAGQLSAARALALSAATFDNSRGTSSADQFTLHAANLLNRGGSITQTGTGATTIDVTGTLDNSAGGTLQTNSTDLTLAPATLDNDGGAIKHAGNGKLSIDAGNGALSNVGGSIASNGQIAIQGGALDNSAGSIAAQNGMAVTVGGALNNARGKLLSNTDLSTASGTLNNNGGQINAGANAAIHSGALTNNGGSIVAPNLAVTTDRTLDNSGGDIEANQLALNAADLLNHAGAITQYGASPLSFNVRGTFDNSAGGSLQSNSANLTLTPAALNNDHGTITHAGNGTLSINAGNGALSNVGGKIASNGQITVKGGALDNTSGSIAAQNGLAVTVGGALNNANGKLLSSTDLNLASATLNNNGGQVSAGANETIHTGALTNKGGSIVAPNLSVTTDGTLDNSGGDIEADQLSVNAADLLNHAGSIAQYGASPMSFNVKGQFDNSAGGSLQSNATDLTLSSAALNNDHGTITHAGNGTLSVNTGKGALSNVGGDIASNGRIAAKGGALNNTSGSIAAQNGLAISVNGALNNANGKLLSSADLSLSSGTLNNNGGQIGAGANETIHTGALTNNGGSIVAPNLSLTADNTLDNSGGDIEANQLAVNAADLLNHAGAITQYGASPMSFNVRGTFDNSAGGSLQTNSADLTLTPATLDNDGGTITHAGIGTLSIDTRNGALSNVGGKIASNGRVAASGGTLDNTAGLIAAQNGLAITVSGALNNANGKLLSSADLSTASGTLNNDNGQIGAGANGSIHTGALTNNGGSIVAPNLSVTTDSTLDNSGGDIEANQLGLNATDLLNHGGTITQYGASSMGFAVRGTFDNSNGGTFQTNSADLTLAPGALINDGGTILDAGTGTLTIAPGNGAGAFSNVGGKIITAGRISAQAASLNNANGVLAAQGDIAVHVAGDVDNTQGALRSLSSMSLTSGGVLTNTNGQIQSGTGAADDASTLDVQSASIDNTNGLVGNLGAGDTTVQGASQIVNAGGVLTGNGHVAAHTGALVNTQNGQLSGANVAVQADTVDNSNGQIGSFAGPNGDVAITTTGAITNTNGQIGATRDLSVNAATLAGGGAYSAAHDVAVRVQGDFSPTPDLQFSAGHNLGFTLPGKFTNDAMLMAVNGLSVDASDIANTGTMMAGGTLATHSNTLENTGTIVGGSVSLNANKSIANVGPTALIGATDDNGTLELLAPDIENRDDTTATNTQATTAIYGLGNVVLAGGKDANGNYTNANVIRNQSGLIASSGDMELDAAQVTNTRTTMTTTGLNQPVDPALLEQLGISMSGCTSAVAGACGGPYVGWISSTPDMIGGVNIEPPHGGQWNSGYQYTTYNGVAVANLVKDTSPQAQIVAGGNLDASNVGLFKNDWSAVTAAGNIAAPVLLDQNSWQGQTAPQVQVTYSGYYHYTNYDHSIADWTLPFGNVPFVGGHPGGYTQVAPADIRTYALPSYESSFVAGGTLSGTGISINNTAGNAGIPSIGLAPGQAMSGVTVSGLSGNASGAAAGATTVNGQVAGAKAGASTVDGQTPGTKAGAATVNGQTSGTKAGAATVDSGARMIDPVIANATAQTVLQNITIPQGGLFSPATASNATYLIATNPAFTNQKHFISSDYYLSQIGFDPQKTEKRLGDGFYEQQLVRNQITSLTGRAVLGPYADLESMYESLLAAGASLSKSLDLPLGMSLSPAQVAALTSNVVIMQTEIVDGQAVLVPAVYLAQSSRQNMNGPLIAATDIDLKNAQTFTNSGTIQAGNTLSIQGQQIDNAFGTLQSGGLMSLTTKGNVDLTSATVNAGSLALNAGGNLTLNTAVKTVNQISATGATRTTATLGPIANVNVAGNASIVTGGDVVQNAGNLNVGGDLDMRVGGNYAIGAVQTGEHKIVERANGVSNTDINQMTGSSIKVGGVSLIGVGGDLSATGARIDLNGGGTLAANGNVTLQAAKATSTIDSNSSGSDSHGSYSESLHRADDTLTATTLNAGNALTVASGKDLNVIGSAINLDAGTATLSAQGDVNIGAATQTHVDNSQEQHSHSNVVSGKEVSSSRDTTVTSSQGSTVSANAVKIGSGNDINVKGSTIVGTNDVSLTAAHDVNIATSQDTMQTSGSYQEKRSGFGTSGLTVTYGSNDTATTDRASSVTNNASTIGSLNGNLSIQAGNSLHVTGSDLIAAKDVIGTGKNVTIDSTVDTAQRAQTQTTHSSGLTLGLSGSIGDAINNAYSEGHAASHSASTGNDRAAALHAIAAAGDAAMTVAGVTGGALMKDPSIGVQLSVGSSSSRSDSSETQTMNRGSNVSANDVLLKATNAVNIVNTTDTESTRSSNSSNSASAHPHPPRIQNHPICQCPSHD